MNMRKFEIKQKKQKNKMINFDENENEEDEACACVYLLEWVSVRRTRVGNPENPSAFLSFPIVDVWIVCFDVATNELAVRSFVHTRDCGN